MKETILFWESDPVLREAMSVSLQGRGFNPVSLEHPSGLETTLSLFDPSLLILEGGWDKGTSVELTADSLFNRSGDLAVILPRKKLEGEPARGRRGIVIANLRKPFGSEQLLEGIRSGLGLRDSLGARTPGAAVEWLEVRRLDGERELEAALRLRRDVYLETGYLGADCPSLECDCFDRRSIILGAFVHSGGRSELAGTLRIIRETAAGPLCDCLERITSGHGMALDAEWQDTRTLPACQSFRVGNRDLLEFQPGFGSPRATTGAAVSSEVCELSRLAVPAAWRRHRLGIERRLFDLVVVDSVSNHPRRNWFVIAVHPTKRLKFHRYGFLALNNLGVRSYAGLDQPAILMTLDLQQYLDTPNPFTANLDQEVLLYRVSGYLSHTPEERDLSVAAAG